MSDGGCEDFLDLLIDTGSGGDGGLASLSLGNLDTPEAFGTTADDTAAPGPFSDVFDINNVPGSGDDGGEAPPRKPLSLAVAGSGAAGSSGVEGSLSAAAAPGTTRASIEEKAPVEAAARGGQLVAQQPSSSIAAAGLVAAGGGADGDNQTSSSHGFVDDDTEKDVVHTSDGNMSVSDGDWCSIIGSNDGEGPETSESNYAPSSDSSSTHPEDVSEMSIVSCQEQDDEAPCMDQPVGMMLAMPDPDDAEGDFICSKVRQRYEKAGHTQGTSEVFEVVFKDGSKTEYGREEVLLYKQAYDENEGGRGCFEFFFKV
ncbi:unnamed protein product [Ectocarpus sp. 8 AP-2014]